jgi:hypothetical protein
MAWTINDEPTLLRCSRSLPSLDWMLSDAPYDSLVEMELAETIGEPSPPFPPAPAFRL